MGHRIAMRIAVALGLILAFAGLSLLCWLGFHSIKTQRFGLDVAAFCLSLAALVAAFCFGSIVALRNPLRASIFFLCGGWLFGLCLAPVVVLHSTLFGLLLGSILLASPALVFAAFWFAASYFWSPP